MDKTLVDLFACHLLVHGFNEDPVDEFVATIRGLEYGPDKMPSLIGLYGAWCSMVVHASECIW